MWSTFRSRILTAPLTRPATRQRRRANPTHLILQVLEDRTAPANFTVNALTDTGAGSGTSGDLRYCITQSNATPGPNSIDATGVTGTISLTSTLPTITDPVTITGPGANLLTVSGSQAYQVFSVNPGGGNSVTMSAMTVSGGSIRNPYVGYGAGIDATSGNLTLSNMTLTGNTTNSRGGAISAANANLTLTNDLITNSFAVQGAGGGGIYIQAGTAVITNTTISGCSAYVGGAIFQISAAVTIAGSTLANNRAELGGAIDIEGVNSGLTITNSTLSANTAYNGGAVNAELMAGPLTGGFNISNSTIANNSALAGGGILLGGFPPPAPYQTFNGSLNLVSDTIVGNTANASGGGIALPMGTGTILLDNTIVSGNSAASGIPDIWANASATVQAEYSAIGTTAGYTLTDLGNNLAPASSTPDALGLEPLANYGGPTQTVAIASNSSAIGMGDPALNGTTDQRGVTRPHQMGPAPQPDIGAFEYSEVLVPAVTGVQVNGGAAQRSRLTTIAVTFNTRVTVGPGAFILTRVGLPNGVAGDNATVGTLSVATQVVNWQTVATLTFAGMNTNGGSLDDGNWTLTVVGTQVTAIADGTAMAADYTQANVNRLFGDSNGDGVINEADMSAFAPAIGSVAGGPTYAAAFDYTGDGFINGLDLIQFRSRIGDSL